MRRFVVISIGAITFFGVWLLLSFLFGDEMDISGAFLVTGIYVIISGIVDVCDRKFTKKNK